jgi:O-antigen/teichoic acid export membrane protein
MTREFDLFRTVGATSVGRAVSVLLTLAIGIALARALGPELYGRYAILIALAAIARVVADVGLGELMARELPSLRATAQSRQAVANIRWSFRSISATSFLVAVAFVAACQWLLPGIDRPAVYAAAALLPAWVFCDHALAIARAEHHPIIAEWMGSVLRPAIFLLATIGVLVVGMKASLCSILTAQTIASMITLAGFLWLLKDSFWREASARLDKQQIRWLWFSALPLAGSELVRTMLGQVGVLALGAMSSAEQSAVYRVADAVANMCAVPITLFSVACSPMIAHHHALSRTDSVQKVVQQAARGMFAAVFVLVILAILVAPLAVPLLFGSAYEGAVLPLQILALSQIVIAMFGPSWAVLSMMGYGKVILTSYVLLLIGQILMLVLLVPIYGAAGAAATAAFGNAMWAAGLRWYTKRVTGIETFVAFARVY